jgi:hypothetical protein
MPLGDGQRFERRLTKKGQARIERMGDPVRGTATVVSSSSPIDGIGEGVASWNGCALTCVLQAEGVSAQTAHERALTSPTNRWPYPNVVLPITVDRVDPTQWVVHWGEMTTARRTNDSQAEALAAFTRGEPGPTRQAGSTAGGSQAGPAPTVSSGSGLDDQLARLQKLGELHAGGVLTDAEFDAQKAKILSG